MKLPGQSRHASKKLTNSLSEVQEGLGTSIVFLPLQNYHNRRFRDIVQGYHDREDGTERIWLDATMPYTEQEAIAAHELAHVMQEKESYPRLFSISGPRGKPLSDSLERLTAKSNNLVMDISADLWAVNHGFDLQRAFTLINMDEIISAIQNQPLKKEAADWETYLARLNRLAGELAQTQQAPADYAIGAEADTQGMALDYAALSLRMGRYGLFDRLDRLWTEHWPVSSQMGKEIAAIVKANGTETPQKCRATFRKVIDFLKIPPPLIEIR
jgi:hypothetical protein